MGNQCNCLNKKEDNKNLVLTKEVLQKEQCKKQEKALNTFSDLSFYSMGSHEISMIFYLNRNIRKRFYYNTLRIPTI